LHFIESALAESFAFGELIQRFDAGTVAGKGNAEVALDELLGGGRTFGQGGVELRGIFRNRRKRAYSCQEFCYLDTCEPHPRISERLFFEKQSISQET
jgi:hypothetical protein